MILIFLFAPRSDEHNRFVGLRQINTLRCVNLLETPTSGQILFHDMDILEKGFNIPAYRAKVGMVFQSFNLFYNMTVLENCIVGR